MDNRYSYQYIVDPQRKSDGCYMEARDHHNMLNKLVSYNEQSDYPNRYVFMGMENIWQNFYVS